MKFRPSVEKFGHIGPDMIELFQKRCLDIAGTLPDTSVYFNGNLLEVDNFQKYCRMYSPGNGSHTVLSPNKGTLKFEKSRQIRELLPYFKNSLIFKNLRNISFVNNVPPANQFYDEK